MPESTGVGGSRAQLARRRAGPRRAGGGARPGRAELELLPLAAGDEPELAEDGPERRARALADAQRLAAPAAHDLVDARAPPRGDLAAADELVDQLLGPLLRERDGAEPGEEQLLRRSRGASFASLVSGLGHAASPAGACAAPRAARRPRPPRRSAPADRLRRSPRPLRPRHRRLGSRRPARLGLLGLGRLGLRSDCSSTASSFSWRPGVLALRVLGLALLEDGEERRGDEDRRVRARGDADEEREREVLERVAAEEEQRRRPAGA